MTSAEGFIRTLREAHPDMELIFMHGSCYRFYLLMKHVFPEAVAYYNIDHVLVKLGDKFYDITGEVRPDDSYFLMTEEWHARQGRHVCQWRLVEPGRVSQPGPFMRLFGLVHHSHKRGCPEGEHCWCAAGGCYE